MTVRIAQRGARLKGLHPEDVMEPDDFHFRRAQNAFCRLTPADKTEFLEWAAERVGARVRQDFEGGAADLAEIIPEMLKLANYRNDR